jgi:hypothetical protein
MILSELSRALSSPHQWREFAQDTQNAVRDPAARMAAGFLRLAALVLWDRRGAFVGDLPIRTVVANRVTTAEVDTAKPRRRLFDATSPPSERAMV